MTSTPTVISQQKRVEFLEHYVALKFNFSAACRAIGRHPTTVYGWIDDDPEFKKAYDLARRVMGDAALAEAYRRAVEGVTKPVFGALPDKGGSGVVGEIQEYSDTLLGQLLRALRPEFRDKSSVDVNVAGKVDVEVSDTALAQKLASIIAVARERQRRGEIIDAEFTEQPKLPAPDNSDLL